MMEIYLEKSKKLLQVLFSDAEVIEKHLEGGLFRRLYRSSRGMIFTFEKSKKGLFLYIGFDRYTDLGVLYQIFNGQSVEELQVLWDIAHLPFAKIYTSNVMLLDGRKVDLIDTVAFEVRKVEDGVWEAGGIESEVSRRNRQMRLNSVKDGIPGVYSELAADAVVSGLAGSARSEVIFADLVTEEESQISAPSLPEERDPNDIAECDGCEDLFYERDLTEVRSGLWLCQFCRIDQGVAQEFGLTPDELPSLGNKTCDGCGILLTKDELTEAEPGRWLCDGCMLHYVGL